MKKCLFCYKTLDQEADFHSKCSKVFFGSSIAPILPYRLDYYPEEVDFELKRLLQD